MADDKVDEVLVYVAQGEMEHQLVHDLLDRHGIPCRYQGEGLRLTHMFTIDGLAEVKLYVPTRFAEQAQGVLEAFEAGDLALEDGDAPTEGTPREDWKKLP